MDDLLPATAASNQEIISDLPMRKVFFFLLLTFLLSSCAASPGTENPTAPVIPSLIIPTPPACTTVQIAPTPGSDAPSLFVPENKGDHVRGAENPILTITEYSDYQDVRS